MGILYLFTAAFSLSASGLDYYGNPQNDPIHPSEVVQKLTFYFTDPDYLSLYGGVLLIIFAFYLFAFRIGRTKPLPDYREVPDPPFQLSPAAIRYVENMGYDTKCLVVAVLNASVKGCYQIRWGKTGFMARQRPEADFGNLSNDEKSTLSYRKDHYWERIHVGQRHSKQTRKMGIRMQKYMHQRYGRLFRKKMPWTIAGIIVSVVLCFLLFGLPQEGSFLGGFFVYLFVSVILILFPLIFLRIAIRDRYGYGIAMCIFFLVAGVAGIGVLEYHSVGPYMTPVLLPIVALNYLFLKKIPTYTKYGQVVMREIRSYRAYLGQQFQEENPVAGRALKSVPYAMALDLEYTHTPYFKNILTQTAYEPYQIFNSVYGK